MARKLEVVPVLVELEASCPAGQASLSATETLTIFPNEAQTEATLADVARALAGVGCDLGDVVKAPVHLSLANPKTPTFQTKENLPTT